MSFKTGKILFLLFMCHLSEALELRNTHTHTHTHTHTDGISKPGLDQSKYPDIYIYIYIYIHMNI